MKKNRNCRRFWALLLAVSLIFSMMPGMAFAAGEQQTDEAGEFCTVTVNFDISSLGTDEALNECGFNEIPSETVTVPKGTKLEEALTKLDNESTDVTLTITDGMLTKVNEVTGNTQDDTFGEMLEGLGVSPIPSEFQYAGWMYSGDGLQGMGIVNDTIEKDTVVNFRYTLYYGNTGDGEWKNFDWEFVDAYHALKAKVADASGLDMTGYTPEEQAKVTEVKDVANTLLTSIENDSQGIWALYIATKNIGLWGPNSVTDQLQKSLKDLTNAIDKVLSPTEIQVTGTTSGGRKLTFKDKEIVNLGESVQLNAKVLPEGAKQEVTFELLYGNGVSVSETGLVTATKADTSAMIKVKSKEDPSVMKLLQLEFKEAPVADNSARIETIMDNIAKSYIENSGEWQVIEMAAYLKYKPDTANKTSDKARQNFINKAIKTISTSTSDTELAKAILGLRGLNGDLENLYAVNSNTSINAIEKLNAVTHSSSAWSAPYTMAAYNQGIKNEEKENALIEEVLKAQNHEGAWDEFGTIIDTTANVIAGLAFYQDRPEVKAAIDKGITYLSSKQEANGAYDGGWGINSNSTAMVIVGLAAAGVNPDKDARFIKNGNSALDGLMSFALDDNSGFGFKDNKAVNAMSTEQSFRALIAAANIMETNKACNVYDFSTNPKEPIRALGEGSTDKPTEPEGEDINVQVTIKADTGYWLENRQVTIPGKGAMVYHAFVKAIEGTGITQVGAENGYIRSMTYNGKTLGEFTNGPNSGWLYKVNGILPDKGISSYAIKNGDAITFYYTEDWKEDPDAGKFPGMEEEKKPVSQDITASVKDGEASVTVPSSDVDKLIADAVKNKATVIDVNVKGADKADKVTVTLPKASVSEIADKTDAALNINTASGNVTLDRRAMTIAVKAASGTDLAIVLEKKATSDAQKAQLGEDAAFADVNLLSGGREITDLGTAKITVELPVSDTLAAKTCALAIMDADGKLTKLSGKVVTVNGKKYFRFETAVFGTFVLAEEAKLDAVIKEQNEQPDHSKVIAGVKATTIKAKSELNKYSVRLTWTKSKGYKVDKYQIYRSAKKDGKFKKIGETAKRTYLNSTGLKKGTRYYYKVRGVRRIDGKNYYTKWSNLANRKMKAASLDYSVKKVSVKAEAAAVKGAVKVSFRKTGTVKVDGYQVYRADKKNGTYKKIATTKKASVKNMKNLKKGRTYYYKVRGYRTLEGKKIYTKWSSKVSAEVK